MGIGIDRELEAEFACPMHMHLVEVEALRQSSDLQRSSGVHASGDAVADLLATNGDTPGGGHNARAPEQARKVPGYWEAGDSSSQNGREIGDDGASQGKAQPPLVP
jgi:hypothetical protein